MFTKKRKILFASEASFANTGFAGIYRELISRVHSDGRFRVAEFASDCVVNDPRDGSIKWRLYANSVLNSDERFSDMQSHPSNKFGRWRLDSVLLDFEPDIVVDLRDPPFFEHEMMSSLREYFHWCIGPTVDSAPQPSSWVDVFLSADSVMPYTDFGYNVLKKEHPGIKLHKDLGPGINTKTFHIKKKAAVRTKYGLDQSSKMLGFVSRNQGRKLIPELIRAFRATLDDSGDENTYLHLHTAHPDNQPWNIPKLLIEENIYDKVLFTYYCTSCNKTSIRKWQTACTNCDECGKQKCIHPRTTLGCDVDTMVDIFNLHDVYIQYSTCEGLGLGTLEAAACGVPVITVDYSAMQDLHKNLGGTPIKCKLNRYIGTDSDRAIPDFDDTVEQLSKLLSLPKEMLAAKGYETRKLCESKYNWDDIASRWIDFFDNVELTGLQGRWGKEPRSEDDRARYSQMPVDNDSSVLEKIERSLIEAGRRDLSERAYINDIYHAYKMHLCGLPHDSISQDELNTLLNNLLTEYINATNINLGRVEMQATDFIKYADTKELSNLG